MEVGDICEGVVLRCEHFGLFVEVDGIPGLLRVPELSWETVAHPSEVAKVGDRIRFQILQVNDADERPGEQFNGSIRTISPRN